MLSHVAKILYYVSSISGPQYLLLDLGKYFVSIRKQIAVPSSLSYLPPLDSVLRPIKEQAGGVKIPPSPLSTNPIMDCNQSIMASS